MSSGSGKLSRPTGERLMNDDAVSSHTSALERKSSSPPTKLEPYSENESITQPGTLVYDLPAPLEGELEWEKRRVACGGYSEVYRGTWTRPGWGTISVAIKRVRRVHLASEDENEDDRFERRIKREVVVWQAAKHPNILEFYGFKFDDDDPLFVSPWCENGNLAQYTRKNPQLTGVEKLKLLHDAAQGLAHLHLLERPIIHGDVKPENIMITNKIKGVLCDFGVSRVITKLGIQTGLTSVGQCSGSPGFQARELLSGLSQPTLMCDVYAFGGVILATMSGNRPFYKLGNQFAAIIAVNDGKTPTPLDHPELPDADTLWKLLKDCWSAEPSQRPGIVKIRELLLEEVQYRSWNLLESVIQPGIPVDDLPSPLEGTLSKTQKIGGGGYCDVYRGEWAQLNKEPISVAIKCVKTARLGDDTEGEENQARFEMRIKREAVVWQTVKHDNILRFHGFQIINGEPMFVSPWCENGNLGEYIALHPELADVKKLELLRDAAEGLTHLHSLEPPIIHGDIKPDNVMVTNDIRGVLCDFGISRVMTSLGMQTGLTRAGQGAGTLGFKAKELHEESSQPTPMSDAYAFGGVILATMSGQRPFYRIQDEFDIVFAIYGQKSPTQSDHPGLPEADPLWHLLNDCWSAEPSQRPRINEIRDLLLKEIQQRPGNFSPASSPQWASGILTPLNPIGPPGPFETPLEI